MIKRQFYKQEHDNDRDDISDSSSSSSSSDSESEVPEAQAEEEEEQEEEDVDDDVDDEEEVVEGETDAFSEPIEDEQPSSLSPGSGYKSEESSEDEVEFGSAGLLVSDDEDETANGRQDLKDSGLMGKSNTEKGETKSDVADDDSAYCILQCGAVFKCRICPRIVCLSEETLRAHLVSKRHGRSKKLLNEGRLKFMLNSDGEVEEDPETHAERHARILALAQKPSNLKKKNRGRQRQRLRLKRKKSGDDSDQEKEKLSVKKNKKMRYNEDSLQKLGDDYDKGKEKPSVKKNKKMRKNEDASQRLGDVSDKGKEKQSLKRKTKKMRKNED